MGILTIENIFLGSLDTGKGNDIITGTGLHGIQNNSSTFTTGDGDDIITGNSNDKLSSNGTGSGITNHGPLDTGDGNDIISATKIEVGFGLNNDSDITTGDGNDTITASGGMGIRNAGTINTGNGADSIVGNGGSSGNANYGIYNFGGTIYTGNGNDSIIANGGFHSAFGSSGSVFLGNDEDYLKGFGSGDFYGGSGNDTLELTPGNYTVGIWGEGGESVIFTKGNQLMITSEFEKLKAGSTIYDFTSLTAGQIIIVA